MTEKQEKILKGTISMYEQSGELVTSVIFDPKDINELVKLNKIKILKNPYKIGDDFFGLIGYNYVTNIFELVKFRKLREKHGVKKAMSMVNHVKL
jgi:hypothetical protein